MNSRCAIAVRRPPRVTDISAEIRGMRMDQAHDYLGKAFQAEGLAKRQRPPEGNVIGKQGPGKRSLWLEDSEGRGSGKR